MSAFIMDVPRRDETVRQWTATARDVFFGRIVERILVVNDDVPMNATPESSPTIHIQSTGAGVDTSSSATDDDVDESGEESESLCL